LQATMVNPNTAGNPRQRNMKIMRTLKAGLALALLGSFLLAPLSATVRQDGVISGSAAAEAKKPYDPYTIRARDVSTNNIAQKTTLDANGEFAVNGLMPGTFLIELVKNAQPSGDGGKIICTAGPFTLQDGSSQLNDLMIKKGANVHCNRPVAAWWLLGAAAAAGVTAGVAAGGTSSGAQ
jgi:hypothetical protein